MNSHEKAELMKGAIYKLYSKEGHSKSYISRLLGINRATVAEKIKEWSFPEPETVNHITKSMEKFINQNRQLIKSRFDANISIADIADELHVSCRIIESCCRYDEVIQKAKEDYLKRLKENHSRLIQEHMNKSSYDYDIVDYPDEEWRQILGYENYMVSNYGRVKSYAKKYNAWHLLTATPNKNNGRMYISLQKDGKRKNLMLARVVAHAFCPGFSEERNTVNHKDGNVQNNLASNLEWLSQGDNERHAYEVLKRTKVNFRTYHFKKIVYENKYEFKTVAALARFLGTSETQTRRYLDNPEKHNLKLIG